MIGGIIALAVLVLGELAACLAAMTQMARSPWCTCGHPAEWHHHDRPGSDCSRCACNRLRAPIIRRDLCRP